MNVVMRKSSLLILLLFTLVSFISSNYAIAQLSVDLSNEKDACDGLANGSIDITVSNSSGPISLLIFGPPNFSFSPNDGDVTSLTNLPARTYLVVAQDDDETVNTSFTIDNIVSPLSVTVDPGSPSDNTSCATPNGFINITVSGGSGIGYDYSWTSTNGFTSTLEDISGIVGGTYTVEVFDQGTNCSEVLTVLPALNDPSPTVYNITNTSPQVVCSTDDVDIILSDSDPVPALPEPPVVYEIYINGAPSGVTRQGDGTSNFAITLPGGSFPDNAVITVQASQGACTPVFMNGSVTLNTQTLSISSSVTDNTRCLAPFNGAIDITVGDAIGTLSYSWTGPNGFTSTSEDITALEQGDYTVTVTDNTTTCSTVFPAITVGDNRPTITITTDNVVDNSRCVAPFNGLIEITPGGTAGPFTYAWTGPNGFTSTSEDISTLEDGSYDITVTDTNTGCTATTSIVVGDAKPTVSITTDNVVDNSNCVAPFNGSIEITPGGTAGPFSYAWIGPNGFTSASEDISTLEDGSYDITVTDTNTGCTATTSIVVGDVKPIITITTDNVVDNSNCVAPFNGSIEITPGGTAGPFSYAWTGPNGFTSTSEDISTLEDGSYDITVTDTNTGCTATTSIVVGDVKPIITITTDNVVDNSNCVAPFNGSIEITPGGTAGPFSYAWTGPNGFTSTSEDISTLEDGSYDITVTDTNTGCTATTSIVVGDAKPTITITTDNVVDNSNCIAPFNGAIEITPGGTAGPFTYAWIGPNGFTSTSEDISTLEDGSYNITVTDTNTGCTATTSIVVGNAKPTITITTDNVVDNSNCIAPFNGSIEITPGGTAGPFTYSWTGPNGFTSTSEDISTLEDGTYDITVTDTNTGCTATTSIVVNDATVAVTITTDNVVDNTSCVLPFNGAIAITPGGSAGPFSYSWTGPNGFTSTSEDISALEDGTYDVTVTDDNTGCIATTSIVVNNAVVAVAITTDNVIDNTNCIAPFDGAINITAGGSAGPFSYSWTGPNGFTSTSEDISALEDGTYDVTVTDDNTGCTATTSIVVNNAVVAVTITTDNVVDNTNCTAPFNGAIAITAGGSIGPFSYSWTGPNGFTSTSEDISALEDGTYDVIVTDDNTGCTATTSIVVNDASVAVTITTDNVVDNTNCIAPFDGAINITAGGSAGPFSYSWTGPNGFTSTNEDISALEDGTYDVTVTDDNTGCTATTSIVVNDASVAVTITTDNVVDNTNCTAPFNGAIDITAGGSAGPFSYSWTGPNGFTSTREDISALEDGTYDVTVTDDNTGCTATTSIVVNDASVAVTITTDNVVDNTNCTAPFNGAIDITAGGSAGPFSYSWTGPNGFTSTGEDISALEDGTYDITVTDTNTGCTATTSIVVNAASSSIIITTDNVVDNTNCTAPFNGAIDITVGGSAGPFTFAWTGPNGFTSTNEDIAVLEDGTYDITVTDTNTGCISTSNIVVGDAKPTITITTDNVTDNTNCVAPFNGAIDITAGGSAGPFSYAWTGPNGFTSTSEDISTLEDGSYDITVTDTNTGCTATTSIVVGDAKPTITITTDNVTDNTNCVAPFNGAIEITAGGSVGPFSYVWTGPSGFTSTSEDITGLEVGTYDITVTDTNTGCTATANIQVNDAVPTIIITTDNVTDNSRCVAPFNGAIDITAGGSAGPFSYAWTGPNGFTSTNEDISALENGSYDVLVTDTNTGCTATTTIAINDVTPLITVNVDATTDNTKCIAPFNGTILITPVGGVGPYSYSWTGPNGFTSTSEDISTLEDGTYDVTVTDSGSGCTTTASIAVGDVRPAITVSIDLVTDNTSCVAPFNGAIEITAGGTAGPFTYSWTGPSGFTSTNEDISGLEAGNYDVTVTDVGTGCTEVASVTVNDNLPTITVSSDIISDNTNCVAPFNGAILITASGTPGPFSYSWTGPNGFTSNNEDITALENGDYDVTVTDISLGCTATATFTVGDNTPTVTVTVDNNIDNTNCTAPFNGAIDITPGGTAGPFTFAWTGPNGFTSTSEDISGLEAGNYDVTVTDAVIGCIGTATITVNDALPTVTITVDGTTDNSNCIAPFNGAIDITAGGTAGPFTYSWTGPNGFTSTIEDISGLESGNYDVTVTDTGIGCTNTITVTVNDATPPVTITLDAVTDNSNCSAPFDGAIDITAGGTAGPFTFAWTGPNGFTSTSEDISGLEAGDYDVTVTDTGLGCVGTTTITVNDALPTVTITVDGTTDNSNCTAPFNGAIDITAGGTAGPFTFAWTGPNGFTSTSEDISGLEAGDYDVTVTDTGIGCTNTITVTVNDALPTVTITVDGTTDNSNCIAPFNGAINITAGGTAGPFTYSWTGPNGFTSTNEDISGLESGDYDVTVTDTGIGCTNTITVTVNDATPPVTITVDAVTDNSNCSAPFNGAIDITAGGTAGPFTFAWTGPNGFASTSEDISGLEAGDYNVTVTDIGLGCVGTTTITVNDALPTVTITVDGTTDNSNCSAPFNGAIDITAGGTAGPFTFAWTGPNGFTSTSEDISGLESGDYDVTVTDTGIGCTNTITVTVNDATPPVTITVDAVTDNSNCTAPFNGAIDITAGGTAGPFTYLWTGPNGFTSTSEDISGLESGDYDVTVTDTGLGCVGSTTITVNDATPLVTITVDGTTDNSNCTAPFNGAIDITAGGTAGPFTFAWTGPNGFTSTSEDISGLESGDYDVTVTDTGIGCTNIITVTVNDATPPVTITVDATTDNSNCTAPFNGAIDITAGGTAGPFTFAWTGPNGFTSTSEDISGLESGDYDVTVTDTGIGCTGTITVTVNDATPPVTITVDGTTDNSNCTAPFNGAIDITAGGTAGPFTFAWTGPNGFTSTSEDISGLESGDYDVVVTDTGLGCTGSTTITVNDATPPVTITVDALTDNSNCVAPFNGAIDITAGGTAGPFTFAWTGPNGFTSTSEDISGLEAGDYDVVVTDTGLGCVGTTTITVNDAAPPVTITVDALTDNSNCIAPFNGAIDITAGGTAGPFTFAWTGPNGFTSTSEDISGLEAGDYDVVVTDTGLGCTGSTTITVNDAAPPVTITVDATTDNSNCVAPFNGAIDITAGGTAGPFTFAWTGPNGFTSTSEDISGLEAGDYDVTVTDTGLGCVGTATITVNDAAPPVTITVDAVTDNSNCTAPFNGAIDITAGGTAGPFTFAWTGPNGFTSTSEDISGLEAGDYDVTVTDTGLGCIGSTTITVNDGTPSITIGVDAVAGNSNCDAPFAGSIGITPGGTAGPFAFSWTGPNGFVSTSEDLTGVYHGTYSVTVTDTNLGCSTTLAISVPDLTSGCVPTGDCATVVVSFPSGYITPATCTNSDGEIIFRISPFVPSLNTTGVIIDIDGPVQRTNVNDSIFSNLPLGVYDYTIQYGDPSCIITGQVTIDQSGTVGTPVASNIVGPVCFGGNGVLNLDVPNETGSLLEWSTDGVLWNSFVAGSQISIPAGPAPTFEQVIAVRRNSSDPCNAAVTVVMQSQNSELNITTSTTDATCDNNDGSITVNSVSGGTGAYSYRLDGIIFNNLPSGNKFENLAGGSHILTVIDDGVTGCEKDFNIIVPFPGLVNFTTNTLDPDCSNNSASNGEIEVVINSIGQFQVGISTNQTTDPTEFFNVSSNGFGSFTFDNLAKGDYYVTVVSTGATCPNRRLVSILAGPSAVTFDYELGCITGGVNRELLLSNIKGDNSSQYTLRVFDSFTSDLVDELTFTLNVGQQFLIQNRTFLNFNKEYKLSLSQEQNVCPGVEIVYEHPDILRIPTKLFALVGETTSSLPDKFTGTMQIHDFSGGEPPYLIRIELDSAAVPGQSFITDYDTVQVNTNLEFERIYEGIPAGRYFIEVMDQYGCVLPLTGRVPLNTDLYVPNIFTPNGDGYNDTFFVRNLPEFDVELVVTNRWGSEVYKSGDYKNDWTGEDVPDGIYFYKIDVAGEVYNGWVEILRGKP
ncbi:gliding motility-associated C-terminal domain-containing protein [Fulvivirga sp. 29W222]|uniref:Gliding motility-associated C-terminal domain-containing protein n=1 Tax=Fulvivirga marina TaxID=2494733 RepID=A0A937KE73_9BACT|nr:gliding motility-associated C-terminal domain-containing protein [Fulvivirga marina]MBL6449432.1 gliding motility-associated C-terminal domain-containing protein [Fulvivirga marina]